MTVPPPPSWSTISKIDVCVGRSCFILLCVYIYIIYVYINCKRTHFSRWFFFCTLGGLDGLNKERSLFAHSMRMWFGGMEFTHATHSTQRNATLKSSTHQLWICIYLYDLRVPQSHSKNICVLFRCVREAFQHTHHIACIIIIDKLLYGWFSKDYLLVVVRLDGKLKRWMDGICGGTPSLCQCVSAWSTPRYLNSQDLTYM